MKTKIIVVFKTHFDIGFTALAKEIVEEYSGKMFDCVQDVCEGTFANEEGLRYIWTMPAWPLIECIDGMTEERKSEAEKLIRRGQLVAHAYPFTTHTEFMGFEELLRVFSYSAEISDTYGVPYPCSAKMTDVPGHTRFLVSVLCKAGVKFLHLGCNSACKSPDVPPLFWWEAPDGSRILVAYSTTYGSDILPDKNWKYPVWLAMQQTNDNTGPQAKEFVSEMIRTVESSGLDAEIKIGTMDDFYNEIIKFDLSDLPVVKQDLADSWIHGIGTYPAEVSRLRRLRSEITAYEKLISSQREVDSLVLTRYVTQIYEKCHLFGEHTWGLDVKTTLGYDRKFDKEGFKKSLDKPAYKRIVDSWNEQKQRVYDACDGLEKMKREFLSSDETGLFNPNGQEYVGYVKTDIIPHSAESFGVKYAKVRIPPFGTKTEFLPLDKVKLSRTNKNIVVENDFLRLKIDCKTGNICTLTELKTGNVLLRDSGYEYEVIGTEKVWNFLRGYCSRYFDWAVNDLGRMNYPLNEENQTFFPEFKEFEFSELGVKAIFVNSEKSVEEYGNAECIEVIYRLLGNKLNIVLNVRDKQVTPIIEGGHFVLDFGRYNSIALNKVGGLVDPTCEIASDANHANYCVENYVNISKESGGVTLVTHDAPLVALGSPKIYDFLPEYKKEKGRVYVNLFNNMWGTNFPQWMGGDYSYEFDIIPDKENVADVQAIYDCVNPPVESFGKNVEYPFACSEGCQLTSVSRVAEKEIAIVLREITGKSQLAELFIGDGFKTAEEVDLYGRTIRPITLENGNVLVKLAPCGFAKIKLFLH